MIGGSSACCAAPTTSRPRSSIRRAQTCVVKLDGRFSSRLYSSSSFTDATVAMKAYTVPTETGERGGVTSYAYDAASNLTSLTDPGGNTTTYGYDNLDRVVSDTNALGGVRAYAYDPLDQLTSQTDRNGRITGGSSRPTPSSWDILDYSANFAARRGDAVSFGATKWAGETSESTSFPYWLFRAGFDSGNMIAHATGLVDNDQ